MPLALCTGLACEALLTSAAIRVQRPGIQVERRYKHFQWMQERLVDKYACICVPSLPSKDFDSKFGKWAAANLTLRVRAMFAFAGVLEASSFACWLLILHFCFPAWFSIVIVWHV